MRKFIQAIRNMCKNILYSGDNATKNPLLQVTSTSTRIKLCRYRKDTYEVVEHGMLLQDYQCNPQNRNKMVHDLKLYIQHSIHMYQDKDLHIYFQYRLYPSDSPRL